MEIELNPGVNYLTGKSGCGKSTVLRAISFLLKNEPHSVDVIRPDKVSETKRAAPTSVTGVFDNGIEVEHIKSASINRYVVRKPGCEEIVYDSIGVNIPEDVKAILQHTTIEIEKEEIDLNFAEQIALPFLYDKSGSFRLKLFNRLTGADLIDKLIQLMNKEILGFGRDIKVEQEFITTNEPRLKEVTIQVTEKTKLLGNFNELKSKLTSKVDLYNKFLDLQNQLQTINNAITQTQSSLQVIKFISQETINNLKASIIKSEALSKVQFSLEDCNKNVVETITNLRQIKSINPDLLKRLKEKIDRVLGLDDINDAWEANKSTLLDAETALKAIKTPKTDIQTVKAKITKLEALKQLWEALKLNAGGIIDNTVSLTAAQPQIAYLNKQYQDLLKEAKYCPVCHQDTSKCEAHT